MTSLQRKFQRAKYGAKAFRRIREERKLTFEQPVKIERDGSYITLRPTRGWLRTSFKRLRVERLLAYLLGGR